MATLQVRFNDLELIVMTAGSTSLALFKLFAEALMGKLSLYISNFLSYHNSVYRTRSSEKIPLTTPSTTTELGKQLFHHMEWIVSHLKSRLTPTSQNF